MFFQNTGLRMSKTCMNETTPHPPSLPKPTLVFKGPSQSKFTHTISLTQSLSLTTLTQAPVTYIEKPTKVVQIQQVITNEQPSRCVLKQKHVQAVPWMPPPPCYTKRAGDEKSPSFLWCAPIMDSLQVWEGGREWQRAFIWGPWL